MTESQDLKDNKLIRAAYRDLLRSIEYKTDEADIKFIRKAFDVALDAHFGVRRKSGEPYITHPISVAQIVASEIGLGPTSIATALLHDVVEDSDYTLEDINSAFGPKVERLIDGLTKISGVIDVGTSQQLENYRKMLLTISDDVRVIIIKLADRLHNMRTMDGMPPHKQLKIASETMYIYAPLAHRLGLHAIKSELEDISLKYTEPEVYNEIAQKLAESTEDEFGYLKTFSDTIAKELRKKRIKFELKQRTKSIYSIRRKMRNQGVSFEEVYDKFAIRIIIETPPHREKSDCWRAYSVVTDNYSPNPLRLRDWISSPKSNGYESLHTTVMGPEGHWVEVQIRSRRMDDVAEKGFAAHWKYKEDASGSDSLDGWLANIREFLENPSLDSEDFVDQFKMNLYTSEIYVFTPTGEMRRLPKGATALDFAFEIHSEVGAHCLGTKVNGKLVPMNKPLKSGDQVEILTSMKQEPKREWLSYVKTSKAKSRIKQSLKNEQRLITGKGQMVLERKLRILKIKATDSNTQKLVNYFGLKNPDELYYKVGTGVIDNKKLREYAKETSGFVNYFKSRIVKSPYAKTKLGTDQSKAGAIPSGDLKLVFGTEETKMQYTLSKCCSPVPGDPVFGFVTSADGLKVHRHDCPNAVVLQSRFANRTLKATWVSQGSETTTVNLTLEGMDRVGLVNELTQVISKQLGVNIKSISLNTDSGVFDGRLTLEITDKVQLTETINNIKSTEGITSVKRTGKI